MDNEILKILNDIEKRENIEILFACELGSRVWGFSNDSSDYDIRILYKKRNLGDYLSITNESDVIEYIGDDVDIVGWDIKKALNLHFRDNPTLREMLISDIVYIDKGISDIFDDLDGFDMNVLKNHYSAFALKHWKKYCGLEFEEAKTKKYLYVVRSILCWNLLNKGIYPPNNIHNLLYHESIEIESDVRDAVENLISFHKNETKLSEDSIFKLNNFILASLNSMDKVKSKSNKDIALYDEKIKQLLLLR